LIRALGNRIKSLFGRINNDKLQEEDKKRSASKGRNNRPGGSNKRSKPKQKNEFPQEKAAAAGQHKKSGKKRRSHSNENPRTHVPAPDLLKPKKIPPKPETLIIPPEEEGKLRFTELPIHEDILFGLQEMEFKYCTPIQEQSLPHLLEGKDIAGKAQTGTGKTAAFLLAAFTHLLNNPPKNPLKGTCRVLVLAPTRELAIQIFKDAEQISRFTPMNNLVIFGGMDHQKQRAMLGRPIDILIGTPGRIIDFSRSRHLDLSHAEMLIIDEADRMLDMGFIPDVRRIIRQLPGKEKRQTLLYSATLDDSILRLANAWLKDDTVTVEIESEQVITDLIEQKFYTVAANEKLAFLLWIINNEPHDRILIFGNRKDKNFRLMKDLQRNNVQCALLSGDIPQKKRLKILEHFREGSEKIVIATDVAARGIHVDDVSLVINFDLPERAEDYVHRIGRTGRAGKKGKSVSLVCEYGAYSLPEIEKLIGEEVHSIYPEESMVTMPKKS
jgi:ATP-dependent RNA helicase RhlB